MIKADLLITDPPYNVEIVGGSHAIPAAERKKKGKLTIQNDKMCSDDFYNFLLKVFRNCYDAIKEGASFYIWHADMTRVDFETALNDAGLKIREVLIWNKSSFVMGRQDYQWKHESCLYGWKDGASHNWYSDRSQTTVFNFDRPSRSELHPTMKPVELFDYQIKNSSKEGDTVLDLFGGSGTTLIACEQNDRNAYLMELDPKYCDVIIKRWETLTGKQAIKL